MTKIPGFTAERSIYDGGLGTTAAPGGVPRGPSAGAEVQPAYCSRAAREACQRYCFSTYGASGFCWNGRCDCNII